MSEQYPGGYMTRTPPVVTSSSAPGIWTLSQQAGYQKQGVWPAPGLGWAGAFTAGDNGSFYAASFDAAGNIVTYGWDSTTSRTILQKLNPTSGAQSWVRTYSSAVATMVDPYQLNNCGRFCFTDGSNNIYSFYTWSLDGGGIIKTDANGTVQGAVYVKPGFLYPGVNIGLTGSTLKMSTQFLSTGGHLSIHTWNTSLSNTGNTRNSGTTAEGGYSAYLSAAGNWWTTGQLGNAVNDNLISKDTSWYRFSPSSSTGYNGSGGAIAEDSSGNIFFSAQTTGGNSYVAKVSSGLSPVWSFLLSQASVSFQGCAVDSSNNWYLLSSSTTSNASLLTKISTSGSIVSQQRFAMTGGSNFTLNSVALDSTGANMILVGRLSSRPFALYIPTTGGAGFSWVVGSATITCTNQTEWTLSSNPFGYSSYSNSSTSPASPSTDTITTTTPTLTWSR